MCSGNVIAAMIAANDVAYRMFSITAVLLRRRNYEASVSETILRASGGRRFYPNVKLIRPWSMHDRQSDRSATLQYACNIQDTV